MANMSYCRFENTAGDLRDCITALEALFEDPDGQALSSREESYALDLEDLCRRYLAARERLGRLQSFPG